MAVPAGHRLLGLGRDATAADLAAEPLIMHSPTQARYFYDLVVEHGADRRPERRAHGSQMLTMLWLVAAGRGVAFVPASAARLPIDGVEFVRLETPVAEPVELHLLWAAELDATRPCGGCSSCSNGLPSHSERRGSPSGRHVMLWRVSHDAKQALGQASWPFLR